MTNCSLPYYRTHNPNHHRTILGLFVSLVSTAAARETAVVSFWDDDGGSLFAADERVTVMEWIDGIPGFGPCAVVDVGDRAWVEGNGAVRGVLFDTEVMTIDAPVPSGARLLPGGLPVNLDALDGIVDGEISTDPDAGAGTAVFLLDSGCQADHPLFEGRVLEAFNGITDTEGDAPDDNGHGTHVAGILLGVAPATTIFCIKVCDSTGACPPSAILRGLQHALRTATAMSTLPTSIANMSLGGSGRSFDIIARATSAIINTAGLPIVAASGNQANGDCDTVPASVEGCIAVNAVDDERVVAGFSNFGECTDVYAPGVDVRSLDLVDPDSEAVLSGTSMAAPHVTGIGAILLSQAPRTPAELRADIRAAAIEDVITGIPPNTGTPNLLAQIPQDSAPATTDPQGPQPTGGDGDDEDVRDEEPQRPVRRIRVPANVNVSLSNRIVACFKSLLALRGKLGHVLISRWW